MDAMPVSSPVHVSPAFSLGAMHDPLPSDDGHGRDTGSWNPAERGRGGFDHRNLPFDRNYFRVYLPVFVGIKSAFNHLFHDRHGRHIACSIERM